MNIVVTGGCGYIGSTLVPRLLGAGARVHVVDTMWYGNHLQDHPNLIISPEDCRDFTVPEGTNAVVHLAAMSNDPSAENSPNLTWETNVLGTYHMVKQAVKAGAKQFIFASSGSVYGIKDEEKVTEDLDPVPISAYNKSKMVGESIVLCEKEEINVTCLRAGTVCGYSPRMRLDLVGNTFTYQAMANRRITVFGGLQQRPIVSIDDVVGAYIYAIRCPISMQGIYNVAFETQSLLELAKMAKQTAEYLVPDPPVVADITESKDPRTYRLCADKIISMGYQPVRSVEMAMLDVARAYRDGLIDGGDICYNAKWMETHGPS